MIFKNLDFKKVGMVGVVIVILFKLINVNVADFSLVNVFMFFGAAVFASLLLGFFKITSGKNKEGYFLNVGLAAILALIFMSQVDLGITNEQSMVELPVQAQSILGFVVEDVVGIPLWFVGLLCIGILIALILNPLLGLGLLLLGAALVLFFIPADGPFGEIIAGSGGIIMTLLGLIKGFSSNSRGISVSEAPVRVPLDFQVVG